MAQAPLTLNKTKSNNPLDDSGSPETPKADAAPAAPAETLKLNIAAPAPEPQKVVQPVFMNALQPAASVYNRWHITVEAKRDPKEILDPQFWAHTARKLRIGDEIRVDWEDGSRWFYLRVNDVGANWAKVSPWAGQENEPRATAEVPVGPYRVSWGGTAQRYRVIRASDKALLQSNFTTMADAVQFAEQELRRQAR